MGAKSKLDQLREDSKNKQAAKTAAKVNANIGGVFPPLKEENVEPTAEELLRSRAHAMGLPDDATEKQIEKAEKKAADKAKADSKKKK